MKRGCQIITSSAIYNPLSLMINVRFRPGDDGFSSNGTNRNRDDTAELRFGVRLNHVLCTWTAEIEWTNENGVLEAKCALSLNVAVERVMAWPIPRCIVDVVENGRPCF